VISMDQGRKVRRMNVQECRLIMKVRQNIYLLGTSLIPDIYGEQPIRGCLACSADTTPDSSARSEDEAQGFPDEAQESSN